MTTGELDLAKRVWTIPAGRAKNKHEHTVPLSDLAVSLIREALADAIDDRVFRLPEHRTISTSPTIKSKFPVRDWTAHDLRRTLLHGNGRPGRLAADCRPCGEPSQARQRRA